MLEFWLERGVDGFRIDTIHHLIKDDEFRDNPPNPDWREGMPPHRRVLRTYTTDHELVHAPERGDVLRRGRSRHSTTARSMASQDVRTRVSSWP